MSKEKRLYERVDVDYPAQCTLTESPYECFAVKIVDIGPEGIGFITDEDLDNHTHIYFKIDLETGEPIRLSAEVMWVRFLANSKQLRIGAKIFDADQEGLERFAGFYFTRLVSIGEGKKKILVIGNKTAMVSLLKVELTRNGYDVVCADDGETGFDQYESEKPDLIISDITLPELNGYEVYRKIRQEKNDNTTPVIMLTAKSADADKIIDGVLGVHKCIAKPFEMEHLLGEIKTLLNPSDVS